MTEHTTSVTLLQMDIPSYFAGWSDAKAGRQYGEGRQGMPLGDSWTVPVEHRPNCSLSGEPCKSWTCLVDRCAND